MTYLQEDDDGVPLYDTLRFQLMWLDINGSGLNMSFADVNELDVADGVLLLGQLQEQKRIEIEMLKRK